MKNWDDVQRLEYDLKLHDELNTNYMAITKLAIIVLKKGIKTVIENPANKPHYLSSYWPLKPTMIDQDRRKNGDRQKKPTQYWFLGFEPKNNFIFEPIDYVKYRTHNKTHDKVERSMIHPQYANRFIRQYLIDGGANDGFM